ncbi:MAG: helix-turn-helix transcriptional regulator [Rhodovibrionaceae bacterium]
MTPFGERLRALRAEKGVQAKEMARMLGVSAAYLSALEHGHRGMPNRRFVHQVCQYFGLIWDDADALQALAELSHPRVVVDSSGLTPAHTRLANLLAKKIRDLDEHEAAALAARLDGGAED